MKILEILPPDLIKNFLNIQITSVIFFSIFYLFQQLFVDWLFFQEYLTKLKYMLFVYTSQHIYNIYLHEFIKEKLLSELAAQS